MKKRLVIIAFAVLSGIGLEAPVSGQSTTFEVVSIKHALATQWVLHAGGALPGPLARQSERVSEMANCSGIGSLAARFEREEAERKVKETRREEQTNAGQGGG